MVLPSAITHSIASMVIAALVRDTIFNVTRVLSRQSLSVTLFNNLQIDHGIFFKVGTKAEMYRSRQGRNWARQG